MATIITRLFKDASSAAAAVSDLKDDGWKDRQLNLIDGSDGLEDMMSAIGIKPEAVSAYAPLVKDGNKLLAVNAPVGQVYAAKAVLDRHPSVDAGLADESSFVRTNLQSSRDLSILKGHPRMFAADFDPGVFQGTKRFGAFLVPLLWSNRPGNFQRVYEGTKRFGAFAFPLQTNKRIGASTAVFEGTKRFGAFAFPLLTKRRVGASMAVFQGTKHFGDFLVPLLPKRD